jgi:hypothetical protein
MDVVFAWILKVWYKWKNRTENLQNTKKKSAKFAVKFLLTAESINVEHEDVNWFVTANQNVAMFQLLCWIATESRKSTANFFDL